MSAYPFSVEIIECDIAIVGAGAAGLRAAIEIAETHPKMRIALISKVYPVRSHTVCAEGGIAGVVREYDNFEKHAIDTIESGGGLTDRDAADFFVKNAPREIIQLEHWGCPFSREKDGSLAVRAFGGMSVKRTVFAADKTGFYILHTLFERSLKHENIKRFDEFFTTSLLCDGGKITGLTALDMRRGKIVAFKAKAVILATGGAGKIYSFTSNSNINTGDGMALAYKIGVPLKDMEFVQFHPTALPRTGILITESARGEGGHLINKNGERFMKKYAPQRLELAKRDIVCRAIFNEIKAGNGFDGASGQYVKLDIRHLGEKTIDEKLPFVREISQDFCGLDPVEEPIPVMPVCHYFMGGIDVNVKTETEIRGLFACGENACTSLHGANRLGSNSLAECLVFGKVAGKTAADFALKNRHGDFSEQVANEGEKEIARILHQKGGENLAEIREAMQNIMQETAWIERNETSLENGLNALVKLHERAARVTINDTSLVYNTELTALFELQNMITLAESVLRSAQSREESRGAHFRTDFPSQNDEKFLKHTLIKKTPSGMMVQEKPVITAK